CDERVAQAGPPGPWGTAGAAEFPGPAAQGRLARGSLAWTRRRRETLSRGLGWRESTPHEIRQRIESDALGPSPAHGQGWTPGPGRRRVALCEGAAQGWSIVGPPPAQGLHR